MLEGTRRFGPRVAGSLSSSGSPLHPGLHPLGPTPLPTPLSSSFPPRPDLSPWDRTSLGGSTLTFLVLPCVSKGLTPSLTQYRASSSV